MATIVEFNQYDQKFDLNSEVVAIKKWLESNWFIPEEINLLELLELIKEISIDIYADYTNSFLFGEECIERLEFVKSKTNNKSLDYTEALSQCLISLTLGLNNYNQRVFDSIIYKVECGKILKNRLMNKNKSYGELLPLNYKNYKKDFESYEDQENLNIEKELNLFKGVVIRRNMTFELPILLNIYHVAYDDIEKGRKPLEVLCNTLLYHFGSIIMHNNTIDLMKELSLIDTKLPIDFEFKGKVSEYLSIVYPNLVKILMVEKNGKSSDYDLSINEDSKEKKQSKEKKENVFLREKELKQEYENLLDSKGL